jgi:hypothetical protein
MGQRLGEDTSANEVLEGCQVGPGISKYLVVRFRLLASILGWRRFGPFTRFPVRFSVTSFNFWVGQVKRLIRKKPVER